jgi:EAL domain-containing protein (putative c-di-GMP-specific phosphodiesterase class I)
LEALRAMGFELALEDFGIFSSSFKYLPDFPMQKIRIDQRVVRPARAGVKRASIVGGQDQFRHVRGRPFGLT